MKRRFFLLSLAASALVLAACAGPTPTAAPAATTAPAATEASTEAAATAAPAATEAPAEATTEATPETTSEATVEATAEMTAAVTAEATAAMTATVAAGAEMTSTAATTASTTLPDLGGREIVIAIENAYIPFNYIPKEGGDPQGWDYDTIAELCKRLNCKPVFQQIAWDNMIAAVAAGQFDMAADGITITDDRAKVVDFSEGYISVDQRILVKKDSPFTSIDEFKDTTGKVKLGSQKGTTNYDEAVKLVGEANVIGFDTYDLAVQAAIAGDVDGTVIDDTAGVGYVGANADSIKLLEGSLVGQELGFVFPKGSDLVAAINAGLTAMKADGSLAKINTTWFGADFATKGVNYDTIQPGATAYPTATPAN